MSGVQIATSTSELQYAIQGYNGISLTNWTVSSASVIAAGSGVEVAGAFFRFSVDDTNDATSFSAITTGATAYLVLTPSGTAGSQIVTSSWTSTAPVWRMDFNGWYQTAASAIRAVAGVVKTGAASYESKFILQDRGTLEGVNTYTGRIVASGGITENSVNIKRKIVEIGDWNMDSSVQTTVDSAIAYASIRNVSVIIRPDSGSGTVMSAIWGYNVAGTIQGDWRIEENSSNIILTRVTSGRFDGANFNATSFNRGWISIDYEE